MKYTCLGGSDVGSIAYDTNKTLSEPHRDQC